MSTLWLRRRSLVVSRRVALSLKPRILTLLGLFPVAERSGLFGLEDLKGLDEIPLLQEGVKLALNHSDTGTVRRLLEVRMCTLRLSRRDYLTCQLVIEALTCLLERMTDLEAADQLLAWLGRWSSDTAFARPALLEDAMTAGFTAAGWHPEAPQEAPVEEVPPSEEPEVPWDHSWPWYFCSVMPASYQARRAFESALRELSPAASAYFVRRQPFLEATHWLEVWPVESRALLLGSWAHGTAPTPTEIDEAEALLDQLNQLRKSSVRDMGEEDVLQLLLNDREKVVRRALDQLREFDPAMAEKLANGYFEYEDLAGLSRKDLSIVLAASRIQDLAISLHGASDKLHQAFLGAMPTGRAANLQIYLSRLGPVDPILVDCHRGTLMSTVRKLELDDRIEIQLVPRNG